MIKPKCILCKKELKNYGGLLISPPNKKKMHRKEHLCILCYNLVRTAIGEYPWEDIRR